MRQTFHSKIVLTLVFVLTILVSGCQTSHPPKAESTQLFSAYAISQSGVLKANGYGYLHFWDNTTQKTVPLCNQQGCLHQTSSCSAYYPNLIRAFYYNDALYFFQYNNADTYSLSVANLFGEERTHLIDMNVFCIPDSLHICDNTLYFMGTRYDKTKDMNVTEACLVNLSSGTFQSIENKSLENTYTYLTDFLATEDYYFELYSGTNVNLPSLFDTESEYLQNVDWDSIPYYYYLYQTNRETGSASLLLSCEALSSESFITALIEYSQDYVLFQWGNSIYKYFPLTNELTLCYDYAGTGIVTGVHKMQDFYLLELDGAENRFLLLNNWSDFYAFGEITDVINGYLGSIGDLAYFVGNGTLFFVPCSDLRNKTYSVYSIDI